MTPVTRKLLQHWADPAREDLMLFCQREAAETAIYVAEVAGRHGEPDFRTRIGPENALHNSGLPRIGMRWPPAAQHGDAPEGHAGVVKVEREVRDPPRFALFVRRGPGDDLGAAA